MFSRLFEKSQEQKPREEEIAKQAGKHRAKQDARLSWVGSSFGLRFLPLAYQCQCPLIHIKISKSSYNTATQHPVDVARFISLSLAKFPPRVSRMDAMQEEGRKRGIQLFRCALQMVCGWEFVVCLVTSKPSIGTNKLQTLYM